MPSPNGIALDPTESWLYVGLTRACQIWRMPLTRDGVTGKVNVFAHTPGGMSGPDGVAVDEDGGVAFANPGHGCIWLLDRHGVPKFRVESCAGRSADQSGLRSGRSQPPRLHRLRHRPGAAKPACPCADTCSPRIGDAVRRVAQPPQPIPNDSDRARGAGYSAAFTRTLAIASSTEGRSMANTDSGVITP